MRKFSKFMNERKNISILLDVYVIAAMMVILMIPFSQEWKDVHYLCKCHGGNDGDPYNFTIVLDIQFFIMWMSQWLRWRSIRLVMENVSEIHLWMSRRLRWWSLPFFSRIKRLSLSWSWRMCLKSILQNVNVPAATMEILTIFLKN